MGPLEATHLFSAKSRTDLSGGDAWLGSIGLREAHGGAEWGELCSVKGPQFSPWLTRLHVVEIYQIFLLVVQPRVVPCITDLFINPHVYDVQRVLK